MTLKTFRLFIGIARDICGIILGILILCGLFTGKLKMHDAIILFAVLTATAVI